MSLKRYVQSPASDGLGNHPELIVGIHFGSVGEFDWLILLP